MKYTKADQSQYPKCPYCESILTEVKYKDLVSYSPLEKKKLILFCPYCSKVLGNSNTIE